MVLYYIFDYFFFFAANEVCEKLAVVGFNTNMISYLTKELHMPLTKAANTLTNFGGTASLTPLLGAFISDSYAGKFMTITVASIIYQIVIFFFYNTIFCFFHFKIYRNIYTLHITQEIKIKLSNVFVK